ncbi:MAG TPA: HNH endonuclease, partial [Steroidobacteraceae bacterium]|nr:HNH endonuclease [Steroidobacteraceae bacterium]
MPERTCSCAHCGDDFTTSHPRKIYCGRKCACAAMNAKHNPRIVHEPRACTWCGDTFTPTRSDSTTCSLRCRNRGHYKPRDRWHDKQCEYCGKDFKSKRSDARYCSNTCNNRVWSPRRNPTKAWTPKQRILPAQRACEGCGADISARMGNARYCEPCGAGRAKVHEQTRLAKRPYYSECIGCGEEFEEPRQQRYCTKTCAGQTNRSKQLSVALAKSCRGCGEQFTTFDIRRNECGTACRQWAAKYPGVLRILDRECRHCAQPYRAVTAAQYFCTPKCSKSFGKIQRRGRMEAAYVEPVSKGAIAKRDRWVCKLCGVKVDRRLEWPHPMSASIDHIVPISKGGEHSNANCQLAHLVC